MAEQRIVEVKAWDMQPEEKGARGNPFFAFTLFRDMGADRSLPKVRVALGRRSGYDRQLEKWSSRYRWVERAAAYDAHLDMKTQERFKDRLIDYREQWLDMEWQDGLMMRDKFMELWNKTRTYERTHTEVLPKLDPVTKQPTGNEIEITTVEMNLRDWKTLVDMRKVVSDHVRRTLDLSDRMSIEVDDWKTKAIRDIREGKIDFESLIFAFGDESQARDLFLLAGVPLP